MEMNSKPTTGQAKAYIKAHQHHVHKHQQQSLRKCLKFKKPNMINFIGTHTTQGIAANKSELNYLNRKRVIQMLDLFNSKYDCKKCRKKLRYKADQIIHSKLKHSSKTTQKLIKCPECDKQFNTYLSLTSHLMTIHLNERPYGCKICHKKFHAFALLKRHCHKKHLNTESSPSSLLSPVSLNSSESPLSTIYNDSTINNENRANNLYDLIDYENSVLIYQTNNDNNSVSVSSPFSESTSSTSSTCSASSTNSHYLPLSTSNPFSINSNSNIKYFNYINRISKDKDLDPIIDYLDEEKHLEKEFNDKLKEQFTFTIITQLSFIKCNICLTKFASNAEYLNHAWHTHLNPKNLKLQINQPTISSMSNIYNHMNSNNIYNNQAADNTNTKSCWKCAITSSKENFKKISFSSEEILVAHLQEHLNETRLFRCDTCPKLTFGSVEMAKAHYLSFHQEGSGEVNNNKNANFLFSCAVCRQVCHDYDSIRKHFEMNSRCNSMWNTNNEKTKCKLCQLEFTQKSFDMHLNQHKFLEQSRLKNATLDKANNIKNSNNNKQYSIDAIVNSPVKLAKKTKLEDIASKISMKQQQQRMPVTFPPQQIWPSLMHLSSSPDLITNQARPNLFASNLQTFINNYTKTKNLNSSEMYANLLKQHSNPFLSPNTSKFSSFPSAFGLANPNNSNNIPSTVGSDVNNLLWNKYNSNLNPLGNFPLSLFSNSNQQKQQQQPATDTETLKQFNQNFIHAQKNLNQCKLSNQRLTIQTAISPSAMSSSSSSLSLSPTSSKVIANLKSNTDSSTSSTLLGFKCQLCGYSFKSVADLDYHRAQHLSRHKKPLKCHLCSIKFSKPDQLIKHMIVHKSNGTDPICTICCATFARKQDLDRHMIFHSKS